MLGTLALLVTLQVPAPTQELVPGARYDPAIPTLQQVVGHDFGEEVTPPDDIVLYISHSIWASRADFEAWTRSESFRKGHANARTPEGVLLGHPQFEGFEQVL